MDSFVTINLDSNFCDICNQDTGEELVDFIVNDKCLRDSENTEAWKRAHQDCLQKWESVMRSTFKQRCPSPKRTWTDKLKDLLNRNTDDTGLLDAWRPIDQNKSDEGCVFGEHDNYETTTTNQQSAVCQQFDEKNEFLVNESYQIERVSGEFEEMCEERARKVRVCSVDLEDDNERQTSDSHASQHEEEVVTAALQTHWTTEKFLMLEKEQVLNILGIYKDKIREASAELITVLQERDSLSQQANSLQVTAGQLVQLQHKQNVKTLRLDLEQTIYHPAPKIV